MNKNQVLEKSRADQLKFFVNIAHEIRTPLTIIKGTATDLKKDNRFQNEHYFASGQFARTRRGYHRLLQARRECFGTKKEPLCIEDLIQNYFEEFEPLIIKKG